MVKRCGIIGLTCVVALAGCTTPGETTGVSAATGGVIGAGLGAIIGSQTGDAGTGVVLGAVAGSSTGALIGNAIEAQENTLKTQDEAIERQERTIAAQRAEIDQLRRLDRDTGVGGRDDAFRGRYGSSSGSRGFNERTTVPHAVMPAPRAGLRESTLPAPVKAVPVKSAPVKSAAKAAPALSKEIAAPAVPAVEAIKPVIETAVDAAVPVEKDAAIGSDVTGALHGVAGGAAGGPECASAAEEVTMAGAAADSADKLFHLRRALRLCPDNAAYHNSLGEVYLSLDRKSDAEYEFREAVSLDPNLDAAVKNLTTLGK